MSLQNAIDNLKELGKELNLPELELDDNKTCILGIDETFSLHLTYEPNTDRLYLYSPLLDGLPKDKETKLRLYTVLLEGSMLGGQMAGGGVGVAEVEELILLHCTIDMKHASSNELRAFVPFFIETVEKWRKKVIAAIEGKEMPADKKEGSSGLSAPTRIPPGMRI